MKFVEISLPYTRKFVIIPSTHTIISNLLKASFVMAVVEVIPNLYPIFCQIILFTSNYFSLFLTPSPIFQAAIF